MLEHLHKADCVILTIPIITVIISVKTTVQCSEYYLCIFGRQNSRWRC